ncbi:transposable element Tcb1 transposase [Trichonephila clavipes]|nr:transposable element Tcb1 transposase [Trichonephila clavipes]
MILRSSPRGLPGHPDPVFRAWVPSGVHCSQQFLTAHPNDPPGQQHGTSTSMQFFIPMIRPLSNKFFNCEKGLLARLLACFAYQSLPTIGGICVDSEGIQRLVWPARSPDLNPIENVWDSLGRQVAGRNYPPTNKNTLIRALTEEWDKLPQQLLDNVVQSMVRRVECYHTPR